jgi:hypothetical protein
MEQMCLLSNINKHSKGLPYEAAFWLLHFTKSFTSCDSMESFFSFADSLQTWYHMQDLVHLKTASTMLAKHVCFWGKQNVKASIIGLSTLSCTIGLLVHKFFNGLYSPSTVWSKQYARIWDLQILIIPLTDAYLSTPCHQSQCS